MQDRALALGNYGEGDRANMILFINMAKRDLESRPEKWLWMRTSATVSTVAASRTVAVPALMKEHGGLYDVENASASPLWTDYPTFDPLGEYISYNADNTTGPPVSYTISEGAFVFEPVPDAIYSYKHIYEAYTADLSADGDTSSIPDGFEDALIYGALMHYAARDKDRQQMAFWQDMYEGRLNKLSAANTFQQNKTIQKISMPAHYNGAFDN
jgi:hypothetical protein